MSLLEGGKEKTPWLGFSFQSRANTTHASHKASRKVLGRGRRPETQTGLRYKDVTPRL